MNLTRWPRLGTLVLLLLFLAALPGRGVEAQQGILDRAATATVRILSCNLSGCNVGLGSGVVIHPSGVILTANHVTLTDAKNPLSPHLEDFVIELTQNARSAPVARYRARLLAAKPESDLALLGVYWDEVARRPLDDTMEISLPALPITDARTIALGDRLHILGYPLAGGTAVNYTPAALGGFDENGAMLKANVSLNEGYSGGPALVERNGQYEIAGVVVLRRQDVSFIRSVDQLGGLIWQPGARRVWADNVRVTTEGSGADQTLRISADIHALDYAGRQGRLLAYAYDSARRLPWLPTDGTPFVGSSGNPWKAPNGQLVLRKDFSVGQPVEIGHAISMELPWSEIGNDSERLLFRLLLWNAGDAQAQWRGADWYSALPATGTASSPQIPPPGFLPSPTSTSRATSTLVPTATPAPSSTWTPAPLPTATLAATRVPTPTRTLAPTAIPTPIPPTSTPTPTLGPGSTRVSEKDGMVMVYVPAGEFMMGSTDADNEAKGDEKPQHKVYLDAFWIDRTEVTNAMFARFVTETGHKTDAEKFGQSYVFNFTTKQWEQTKGADWQHPRGPGSDIKGLEQHPVINVDWDDAVAYCRWAGRRLPTEAEREKAARGTDGRKYPWGAQGVAGNQLNFADRNLDVMSWADKSVDDGYQFTAPVGTYLAGASPYGALDMAGNVWEWVADRYNKDYYANSPAENPQGPDSGDERVLRGGSWDDDLRSVRAAVRLRLSPDYRNGSLGFRCVRSP